MEYRLLACLITLVVSTPTVMLTARCDETAQGEITVNLDEPLNKMLYMTVLIKTENQTKTQEEQGTGFFFVLPVGPNRMMQLLVTNKHVVRNAAVGHLRFHTYNAAKAGPSGKTFLLDVSGFKEGWIDHPDPNIDLCAIPTKPFHDAAEKQGVTLYTMSLSPDAITGTQELAAAKAVENVIMVGYPIGLSDEIHNFPLIRRGITACHPSVDFQGLPQLPLDIAAFPGSSGSPVFLYNHNLWTQPDGNIAIGGGTRATFLGVLYAGPTYTVEGTMKLENIPTAVQPVLKMSLIPNLGYAIKAHEVLVLAEYIHSKQKSP